MGTYESSPSNQLQSAPPDLQVLNDIPELPETPNETAPQDSGDFYTPELERGEIIDFPTPEGMETETGEELSPAAIEAIEKLEVMYPDLYRDMSLTELAETSQAETFELLAEARAELGLTEDLEEADPESLAHMQQTLEDLRPQLEATLEQIEALEQIALDLPEALRQQLEEAERQQEQIKVELDMQMEDFLEAASRLQREMAVKSFIHDSIQKMGSENADLFSQAENAEAAQQIMTAKIYSRVWEAAQTFIEKGGRPDYGFHLEITLTAHEDENGEEKIYITEIDLEIRASGESSGGRHEKAA